MDEYGETDSGLIRGNPLHLDPTKYNDLAKVWINGDIPARIARSFDPENPITADWFTL